MDSTAGCRPRARASAAICAANVDLPEPCKPLIASTGTAARTDSAAASAASTHSDAKPSPLPGCVDADIARQ